MSEKMTGYPSIDKPWLKWYKKENLNKKIPEYNLLADLYLNNKDNMDGFAIRYMGKRITYRELFRGIACAEEVLEELILSETKSVTFISLFNPDMVYIFYALNHMGIICNMIDPQLPIDEICRKINKMESHYVVIQDVFAKSIPRILEQVELEKIILISTNFGDSTTGVMIDKMPNKINDDISLSNKVICWNLESKERCSLSCLEKNLEVSRDKIAAVFYTGGTTGESKGVELTNYNIVSVGVQFGNLTNRFSRGQTWLTTSVPFVAYVFVIAFHMPLTFGIECCIEMFDPKQLVNNVIANEYNHISASPAFYEELLKYEKDDIDLSFIEMPITGADKLSEKLYRDINSFLKEHNCEWNLCNGYGMTEVASGVCVSYLGASNKAGSVGIPFSDTIISAFDVLTGKECVIGESGEICISGPSVMAGYYKEKEATENVLKQHDGRLWMHTGDIGHIDEDGCVFIEGRIKRMIMTYKAFKIFPSAVEEVILSHPDVDNCSCVSIPDKTHNAGCLPAVVIVLKDNNQDEECIIDELIELCKAHLPEYSIPYDYYFKKELPLTHAGKIDYRKLEDEINTGNV